MAASPSPTKLPSADAISPWGRGLPVVAAAAARGGGGRHNRGHRQRCEGQALQRHKLQETLQSCGLDYTIHRREFWSSRRREGGFLCPRLSILFSVTRPVDLCMPAPPCLVPSPQQSMHRFSPRVNYDISPRSLIPFNGAASAIPCRLALAAPIIFLRFR